MELREGPVVAVVRKDFLPAFRTYGLAEAASGEAEPETDPATRRTAGGDDPLAAGRGAVRTVPAGPLGRAAVRRCLRGGLASRFVRDRYLIGDRARDELILTDELHRLGLPVPEPLAAVRREEAVGYRAALATRLIPDVRPLSSLLAEDGKDEDGKDENDGPAAREGTSPPAGPLMARAGTAVGRLHAAGVFHADLNAHNLLLDPRRPERPAHVVDLDRGRRLPFPLPGPLARANLRRLRRSLRKLELAAGLEAWDTFLAAHGAGYRGGGG